MTTYLVEVPHEDSKVACARAIRTFLESGFHFMTNADWGCADDEHTAWFTVDLESKDEVRMVLPPMFRDDAKITAVRKFTREEVDTIMAEHNG